MTASPLPHECSSVIKFKNGLFVSVFNRDSLKIRNIIGDGDRKRALFLVLGNLRPRPCRIELPCHIDHLKLTATLSENCSLLGTDDVRGQISAHRTYIFSRQMEAVVYISLASVKPIAKAIRRTSRRG